MIGKTYGRLTILRIYSRYCDCKCACGNMKLRADTHAVRTGNTKSCGCYSKEHPAHLTHGNTRSKIISPEYNAWSSAKARCALVKNKRYPRYGARGIKMCEEWLNDFSAFLAHVGPRPSPDHSIERKDTNKDYEPGNVCWATDTEQANNRTNNVRLQYEGKNMTLAQISKAANVPYHWLYRRVVSNKHTLTKALHDFVDLRSKDRH
jgi:hypothetical protein